MPKIELSRQEIDDARRDLPYLKSAVYVDNAAVTPVPLRVQVAANNYTELTVHRVRESMDLSMQEFDRGRALAGKLVGGKPTGIAFIQNTSHGLSLVALGLDWRSGDNLVVPADEFPSNYLCWIQLQALGVEVRRVPSSGGRISAEDLQPFIDARTRLVAISHVQFYSGFRVNLAEISTLCAKFDSLLVVDGTQSIGAIEIDVQAEGVDVLVVSGHKWMMAPRGVGFMAFSDRALKLVKPRVVGWLSVNEPFAFKRTLDMRPDAASFEPGTPNGAGIFGLTERLRQIDELGHRAIHARVIHLQEYLAKQCVAVGLESVYSFEEKSRSGIFLVRRAGVPSEVLLAALNSEGIYASVRSASIRLSPHYFNTEDELDRTVAVMSNSLATV